MKALAVGVYGGNLVFPLCAVLLYMHISRRAFLTIDLL